MNIPCIFTFNRFPTFVLHRRRFVPLTRGVTVHAAAVLRRQRVDNLLRQRLRKCNRTALSGETVRHGIQRRRHLHALVLHPPALRTLHFLRLNGVLADVIRPGRHFRGFLGRDGAQTRARPLDLPGDSLVLRRQRFYPRLFLQVVVHRRQRFNLALVRRIVRPVLDFIVRKIFNRRHRGHFHRAVYG